MRSYTRIIPAWSQWHDAFVLVASMAVLSGCATSRPSEPAPTETRAPVISGAATQPAAPSTPAPPSSAPSATAPASAPAAVPAMPSNAKPVPAVSQAPPAIFRPAGWHELPGWAEDNVAEVWAGFMSGCSAVGTRDPWREVCTAAARLANPSPEAARRFFETQFTPYRVGSDSSGDEGLITGYYEPLLRGSRKPTGRYRYALYGVPDDLVVVDLGEQYPELKNMRLRGRLDGRRLVPYYDRAQIEGGQAPVRGREIVWVDDAIELFFLHVQGSGRILLDGGETIRVGYADQNGYPYRSIGRLLAERGELPLDQVSMQSIVAWARRNPAKVNELLNSNASFVFFRELPASNAGPPGSLGVPLTARRSIAVDPRYVPLGAPVFIATTWPNSTKPLNRLMLAQDTGSAIRGPVRADFFWGFGEAAAREAGRMKQPLRMWVMWPRGQTFPISENSFR